MKIRWEQDAVADLIDLRSFIAQDNPVAARQTARRILTATSMLPEQPLLGSPGRIHETRELVVPGTPYTIIYHTSADTLSILRVFHQARQWPSRP